MRPIVKTGTNGNPKEYNPWGSAKEDLINEIGDYCSYCEKKVNCSSIHIEHVRGKKVKDNAGVLIYDHLKFRWDNFLLACCNCNSVKDNKDIVLTNPFLPHENNLLHFIEISQGGLIKIKNGVAGNNLLRTTSFIDLVGLDRKPGDPNYSDKDDRWDYRLKAMDVAERQFQRYTSKQVDIETIVSLAEALGFFSVWYYQFYGHDEVINALINGIVVNGNHLTPFKGTHSASFQGPNFSTVERP